MTHDHDASTTPEPGDPVAELRVGPLYLCLAHVPHRVVSTVVGLAVGGSTVLAWWPPR